MKIYIASSWKNQHAVEMLTTFLRNEGYEVNSFVEQACTKERCYEKNNFDEWVWSDEGKQKFEYDTNMATTADLVVYIGPSGTDAWAKVGAAWAVGKLIIGLHAKGEPSGLMRRMVTWCKSYKELLELLKTERV